MADRVRVPLGEVATFQRGHDITKKEQTPGPYAVISSGGASSTHNEFKYEGPGVVIGRKGTLGSVYWSSEPYWPHDTTLWVKDFKGNHPRYVYYLLQTLGLERFDSGASNPTLNRNHIHLLDVEVLQPVDQPPVARAIARFDDLIENNRRRIEILEEMARLLYREWFVHFRFPGHDDVEMVDSELGPIPEGWEVVCLVDYAAYINRGIAPKYADESDKIVINQKCIRDGRLTLDKARRQIKTVPPEKVVREGDILINSTGVGTLGRVAPVREYIENATVDSHVTIVRPPAGESHDFFASLLLELQPRFEAMGAGSTGQTELARARVGELKVVRPVPDVTGRFAEVASPMRELHVNLSHQNRVLKEARDLLLPRLVSGELDVSDLELDGVLA